MRKPLTILQEFHRIKAEGTYEEFETYISNIAESEWIALRELANIVQHLADSELRRLNARQWAKTFFAPKR